MRTGLPRLRHSLLAVAVVTGIAAGGASPARAADDGSVAQEAPRRPRIGLALGGGSARGIAHIGVLEWFEEHRIPIDVISGTSMGGLIAGAYASGMTPAEIRALMKDVDWDLMFIADSPFRYKTFRRKVDKRAYPAQLEFGLKGGLRLPTGLNPGQQVTMLLDRIALPYYALRDFDALPTPFRCVATDLKKAEPVVLGKGSLAQALRATMAIPGVFTPVNYDDWLLVDGGVLNNIPADVTRGMGADIVIAVNVGAEPLEDKNARDTLFTLLGRTIDTMMTSRVRESLTAATIVLDPDLKGLDSMSWRRSDDLADRGYAAAKAEADRLLRYQVDEATHAANLAARAARRRTAVPTPEFVTVTGVSGRAEQFISRVMHDQIGTAFDRVAVEDRISTVSGTDRYEYLSYRITERDGQSGLAVTVRQKDYGPPFLALGVEMSNVDSSNFAVNASGRAIMYDVLGAGSEARVDVVVGTRQRLAFELYRPFGESPLFVAARAAFSRSTRNSYQDERLVAEYRVKRTGAGVDLGATFGRRTEIRFGYDVADVRGRLRVGSPFLPEVSGAERFATARLVFDGQTSPVVPTRGVYLSARLRHYFSASHPAGPDGSLVPETAGRFWQSEIAGNVFHRVGTRGDRMFISYGVGNTFASEGDEPTINDFLLGGPLRLGAFNNDELHGNNYLLGSVGYLRTFGRLPDILGGSVFILGAFEQGTAYTRWEDAGYASSVTLGAVAETLVGPIFAGGSSDFGGRFRIYIAIGPLFR